MKEADQTDGIALAHHWLLSMRGGERVLEAIAAKVPEAPIFTLAAIRDRLRPSLAGRKILEPPLSRFYRNQIRKLVPLHPLLVRTLRVPAETRLVISSDAAMIKGIRIPRGVPHLCYCHSPPRYLWEPDILKGYLHAGPALAAEGLHALAGPLRVFDRGAARRVSLFLVNSEFVQSRVRAHYGRKSVVIHPPVNVEGFVHDRPREDFYLVVSQLSGYKRVDLAIEACSRLHRRLVVIGSGPLFERCKKIAGPSVSILQSQSDAVIKDRLETCRAFLSPQVEDFGIAIAEAQAAGAPVIAHGKGGACEIVRENETGLFFHEQTAESLIEAILEFEKRAPFDPAACRANALRFDRGVFDRKFGEILGSFLRRHKAPEPL